MEGLCVHRAHVGARHLGPGLRRDERIDFAAFDELQPIHPEDFHTEYLTHRDPHVPVLFMATPTDIAERHAQVLAELAELGLGVARRLAELALAAETPKEAADLGVAFHRVSRSVRQTLALDARLARDHLRLGAEVREEAEAQRRVRCERRKGQVWKTLEAEVWREYERDDVEEVLEDLDARLSADLTAEDFDAEPVEAHIARLRADIGLAAPEAAAPSDPEIPEPSTPPPVPWDGCWRPDTPDPP
jgi:hypothetical protein